MRFLAAACIALAGTAALVFLLASHSSPNHVLPPAAPLTVGKDTELHAVTCTSARFCLAVGSYSDDGSSNDRKPLVEKWDGTEWAVVPAQARAADTVLNGVGCSSSSSCMAVGSQVADLLSSRQAFAMRWHDGALAALTLPAQAGDTVLNGVVCPLENRCISVGSSKSGQLPLALVATWDGMAWTAAAAAMPSDGVDSWLNSISCTAPRACVAVGAYSSSGDHDDPVTSTLIDDFDGFRWSSVASPAPGAGDIGVLSSVACPSTSICVAVGNYSQVNQAYGDDSQALVATGGGVRWASVIDTRARPGDQSALQSVACAAVDRCIAVGAAPKARYGPADGVIGRVMGNGWERSSLDLPGTVLESVACPSRICLAVGEAAGGSKAVGIWWAAPP